MNINGVSSVMQRTWFSSFLYSLQVLSSSLSPPSPFHAWQKGPSWLFLPVPLEGELRIELEQVLYHVNMFFVPMSQVWARVFPLSPFVSRALKANSKAWLGAGKKTKRLLPCWSWPSLACENKSNFFFCSLLRSEAEQRKRGQCHNNSW